LRQVERRSRSLHAAARVSWLLYFPAVPWVLGVGDAKAVPREEFAPATRLDMVSVNVSRAAGPAIEDTAFAHVTGRPRTQHLLPATARLHDQGASR
jgi:hypothetical protein